jgi:ribosomal protein S30
MKPKKNWIIINQVENGQLEVNSIKNRRNYESRIHKVQKTKRKYE